MDRSFGLLLALIGTLTIIHIVQAQSQQGFISLDCGLPENETSPYKERTTGLQFSSDITFIRSGKRGRIKPKPENDFLKPHMTLRYFPDGVRNCYNLRVAKGRNHLIRANFVYGNYDGLDISPMFDMYVGPNLWVTINMENQEIGIRKEIMHIPTSNLLQICLVKTGDTTPIISSLEIRPIRNDTYITTFGSLELLGRMYLSNSSSYLRFPDDNYDLQWTAYFHTEWTHISTNGNVVNIQDFPPPPKAALSTAATPTNVTEPLTFEWASENLDDQYYLYAHFAEIQELRTNDTREFNIMLNGNYFYGPMVPEKLSLLTVFSQLPDSCPKGKCSFQLVRTNKSTLPPLLNAFELYRVIEFPQFVTSENEVVAMKNIEATYTLNRITWQGDPCAPKQFMWDGLNCSNTDILTPPKIISLNLSSSGLTGTIAAALQNLTHLEKLDLSNNNLTGEVPDFLGNMKSLMVIDLSGNNLNCSIPQSMKRKGLELFCQGNPRPSRSPCSSTNIRCRSVLIPIVVSVCFVAIFAVGLVYLILRKKRSSAVEEPPIALKKRRFTYSEVIEMTKSFERVIGKGGFGVVCHGIVNGSEQVAVKVLSQSSTQGYKEFKAEVDLLLRVHHTNLVSLVGYCDERDHLALIYEFIPNGDLKQHLSGKGGKSVISWSIRLKIAVEAAQGLEYLHIGCTPPMVHRDVKTTNILLDEHYKAKLADFGLSRSFPVGSESHVSTVVVGTLGYLDPEYYNTSRLSEKSDVYSFGVVLLEMITNQPVIDQNRRKPHIAQWVGSELKGGDITKIMDPNLHEEYDSRTVWRALELAMACADPTSAGRPTMSKVVIELNECLASENSRSPKVSMIFDSGMIPKAR